jgi:hypothetical protein
MSKEYKAYRFFVMIYVLVIANFAILITEGFGYYIWFCSSIVLLSLLLIYEKDKVLNLMKHFAGYKLSRECIFLIVFVITYPRHYQLYRHLDYGYVALLQLVNVLLFILVFCVKKKSLEPPKKL